MNNKLYEGKTPLMCACESDNLDIVKLLIEDGADSNIVRNEPEPLTPLIISVRKVNYYNSLEKPWNH